MPITTPEHFVSQYSNDKDHFLHVLDHLIIPAIEKTGLIPIEPISRGSEVIHAEIIQNIESCDFVLCDMSTLNPNVFFELGIRTALNKPVCLIRDDLTPKIPFDTAPINNHTYLSCLHPWILEDEIEKLSEHLKESIKKNNASNSLWKYFSLSSIAQPIQPDKGTGGKIELLTMQVDALRREIKENNQNTSNKSYERNPDLRLPDRIMRQLLANLFSLGKITSMTPLLDGSTVISFESPGPTEEHIKIMNDFATEHDFRLEIIGRKALLTNLYSKKTLKDYC
jgi:hypothetical protein